MQFTLERYLGVFLLIAALFLGSTLYQIGVLGNLLPTMQEAIVGVLAVLVAGGIILLYYGRPSHNGKERGAKRRRVILKALEGYIKDLISIKGNETYPVGSYIQNFGWSDIKHQQKTEEFLNKFEYYEKWKEHVEYWNTYKRKSEEEIRIMNVVHADMPLDWKELEKQQWEKLLETRNMIVKNLKELTNEIESRRLLTEN